MNNKLKNKILIVVLLILSIISIIYHLKFVNNNEVVDSFVDINVVSGLDSLNVSVLDTCVEYSKFNLTYNAFKTYNKNIDTISVNKFIEVSKMFKLDTNTTFYKKYICQILSESSAKHFKNGKIHLSYAGAVGLCQIMPMTCYDYLLKLSDDDKVKLNLLSVTNFNFVYNKNITLLEKKRLCYKWLLNINNNIVMWGLITSKSLNKINNIDKHLIAYNMGYTGMLRYLNRGGKVNKHDYIRMINNKISDL